MIKHIPNILTVVRILLIPLLVILYFVEPRSWLPVQLYFFICITDFFDGYLARKLDAHSALGAFLDPVADKLLVSTLLLMLVADYQAWYITLPAMVIIAREVAMSAFREWMAKRNLSSLVAVDSLGKVKTTFQMFALAFLLAPQNFMLVAIGVFLLYASTYLTVYTFVQYIIKATTKQMSRTIIHHTN